MKILMFLILVFFLILTGCSVDTTEPEAQTALQNNINFVFDAEVSEEFFTTTEIVGEYDSELQEVEKNVVALINEIRIKNGLTPLIQNDELTAAARIRAREITFNPSHTRPDGRAFETILYEQNIVFKTAAENIAGGQKDEVEVVGDWMDSQSHSESILTATYSEVGVGCFREESEGFYWVMILKEILPTPNQTF